MPSVIGHYHISTGMLLLLSGSVSACLLFILLFLHIKAKVQKAAQLKGKAIPQPVKHKSSPKNRKPRKRR